MTRTQTLNTERDAVIVWNVLGAWLLTQGRREDRCGQSLQSIVEECKRRGLRLCEIRPTFPRQQFL